jgi:long-chain acyl-CoA synthetase
VAGRHSLASLIDDFERLSRQTAIVAPRGLRQRRTTYGELANLSRRFAADLADRGVIKGDRVLIWGENGAEWVATFFGCVLRGVLPVPVDAASTRDFVQRVEREVSPKLITGNTQKVKALTSGTPSLFFERFDQTITSARAGAIEDLHQTDALQIVFTSGTTGEPKGIVHTHNNVLASLRPIETEAQKYLKYEWLVHPIRILHTLPLSHVFGQFLGLWIPPVLRTEVHYEPRLVAADLVERIHTERISVLAAVPRVLDLLQHYLLDRFPDLFTRIEHARNMKAWQRWWYFRDVHRVFGLKFWAFVCGGASLTPAGEQFWNTLGFVVIQGYGMTETTALVSLNHPFRAAQGTIGQVLPGREVQLTDEGEVLVRGDTISNATWQAGQLRHQDSDWLATGDLADFDEHGNLRFRGRKKDVIVTSAGLNIYPEDLEAALNRQAGVKACTIFETSTEHGPEPLAAIVLNGQGNANGVVAAANRELAEFQQIRRWIVWPEPDLPRTSTGKVLRREVARRIANGEIPSGELPESGGELELDSLGRVQLQARLEQQYGVSLDDAALQEVKTGEDVRKLIAQAPPGSLGQRPSRTEQMYPHWPWNLPMQAIRGFFLELLAMPLLRFLAGKPRVISSVRDWPSSPILIVCNHVTAYDPAFVLYALPGRIRRRVAIAMAGEMLLDFRRGRNQENWFLNLTVPIAYLLITGLFNVFPLPQLSGFRRSFRHAGEAMDRGYNVLVFPEGRRSDDEGALPFKSGAGLLWKELATPALPVRLHGLGEIKAQHARWFRTNRISVSVGRLLPLDVDKSPEELTEILRQGIFSEAHDGQMAEPTPVR